MKTTSNAQVQMNARLLVAKSQIEAEGNVNAGTKG
jgi:hypothetical protein